MTLQESSAHIISWLCQVEFQWSTHFFLYHFPRYPKSNSDCEYWSSWWVSCLALSTPPLIVSTRIEVVRYYSVLPISIGWGSYIPNNRLWRHNRRRLSRVFSVAPAQGWTTSNALRTAVDQMSRTSPQIPNVGTLNASLSLWLGKLPRSACTDRRLQIPGQHTASLF